MPLNESSTKLLTRNHVNHKLETILDYPVFFVIAPIGYGKTTAISTFLEKSKYRNIWITMHAPIDISSNEYFWYLIANEIKKYSLEISDSFMDRGFPNDSIQISRIVEFIKNINVKEDIIVVVDDYHLIENEKINLLMKSLIYERIPWLHIILSSRTIPDLAIQELYFKGYCNQINIKDLTFTNNEVKRYLRLVNFKANEKIEQKICEYSNGWFPAIYLMQAYYRQNLKLNTKNSIYSLIKFSFFDKYDETIKMLLINLSILENVNADQAVYIFENDAVIDILNKLCQENAFITIDHQSTYRLHHIYIDFLTELKKEWDDETIKIIQRAARWFSNHGDNILAFKYWFLIKDFKSILQELESEDRNSINFVDRDLIIQIFESVDNELKYQYPIATLKYILIIILYKDRNLGKEMIVPFKHYFDSHTHPKYHKNRIFAELYLLCTSLSFNNARLSAYFSRQAYHLLDGEYSITMNRHDVIAHGFPHFTYAYFKQPGEYKETVKTLSNDFIYLTKATNGLGMGCDILSKAEYSLETGSFDDVESQSLAAFYKSSIFRQTCLQVCAKLNLAR